MPGVKLEVTSKDLRKLSQDLKAAPGNMQVELRQGMTKAAQPMVDRVKSAAGFSSRIPGATKAKVSYSAKSAGVTVQVDPKRAPEAAPLEHGGKSGTFRHKVFGHGVWVDQQARPFFYPNVAKDAEVTKALTDVMDAFSKKLGFK